MALKAVEDSLDSVPEHFRELYTERNGKFEFTGVEGLKTQADVDRLQSSLVKERNDHKTTKERLGLYGDLDPTKVHEQLDRIPELEAAAAGKLDENKLNELVEGRIKTRMAPLQRELETTKSKFGEAAALIDSYKQKETRRSIHDAVREAALKTNMLPAAVEDALMLGERLFEVTEEGKVVVRDNVGFTPGVEASVWITDMQQKRPHWWGPSQGGGAGGSGGGPAGSNPWSAASWNMTEQGRIYRENPQRAEQLARQAGTTIGGARPVAKK